MKTRSNNNDYRLRVVTNNTQRTYILRQDGHVTYVDAEEASLALSSLVHGEAAELRFALEDALNGNKAAKAVRAALKTAFPDTNEDQLPRIEVL